MAAPTCLPVEPAACDTAIQTPGNGAEPPPSPARAPTYHSIQALRAIAAMLVVFFHSQQSFANAGSPTVITNEGYLFSFGAVGVHIFFVISGFIMVYTSHPDHGYDAKVFLRRRLLRIYPIYWICAGLFLLIHFLFLQEYSLSAGEAIAALLLVPGQASKIIGPAWTLAFEMYFYICFGLAMMLGLTRGLVALSAFFAVSIIIKPFIGINQSALNLASNPLLLEFLSGCAVGWLLDRNLLPRRGGPAVIALSLGLFVAGIAVGFHGFPGLLIWGLPSFLLVCGCVMAERTSGASRLVRRVGYYGGSSYALYLIHILIISVALALAGATGELSSVPTLVAVAVLALLALCSAEALHHWVENPLLRVVHQRRARVPMLHRKSRAEVSGTQHQHGA